MSIIWTGFLPLVYVGPYRYNSPFTQEITCRGTVRLSFVRQWLTEWMLSERATAGGLG